MFRFLIVVCALAALLTRTRAADPFISEFMASNQNSIVDEDGSRSDWIEIHNPGPAPADLTGWFLTDDVANKTKWSFPTVMLNAGAQLIVFASGKDRRNPAATLHANFSLAAGGEYLALVKPDGVTVAHSFAPAFPAQYEDVSYGVAAPLADLLLMDRATGVNVAARAYVPVANDPIGTSWRATGFNDANWQTGNLAVGYFRANSNPNLGGQIALNVEAQMYNLRTSCYARVPFTVPAGQTVVGLRLRMLYDDGFAAFLDGAPVAASNPAGGAPAGINSAPAYAALNSESAATASHNPATEEYNLDSFAGSLTPGSHVLALHLLNVNTTSSDLIGEPQLVAKVTGGVAQTGYFASATPGSVNGGNNTLLLPQSIAYSRPSGTFQTTFDLTLSGAAAGQVIRYVIADPTPTTGANIPEPTAASQPYTGPISIPTSKLLRAAVFTTDGSQKGATSTGQYLLLETAAANNTTNFSSNLPIIVLNDHGAGQPVFGDSLTYTAGVMHIFEPIAGVASLNGTANNGVSSLSSRMGFRYRGSSSSGFPKKSYGLETWSEKNDDFDRSLLSLEADSDWVFNGPYQYDDTFIHNAFIYEVSRRLGRWAPRTKFCEVFVDQNGGKLDYQDYTGIYVLTEKIKSNSARLDITGITPADNASEALTGGYIFKIDRAESDEVNWQTTTGVPNAESGQRLTLVEPDPGFDTPQQVSYIQGYVQQFDTTIANEVAGGFATRNYRNYIDVPSFIDHHILNALAYNADGLRLSAYYFKDRNAKINAGPLWDFDRALGSDDGRDSNPSSWNSITYYFDRDWWGRLFKDPDFVQAWVDRWRELRTAGAPLELVQLTSISNAMGAQIGNAAGARDAAKWPQNAPDAGQVYLQEITKMNSWLGSRVAFIDSQLPAYPNANVASGAVNAGSSVTLTGSGTLRYTLDGSDPRPPGGGAVSTALTYTGPITINQTTVITVRAQITTTPFPNGAVSIGWGPPRTLVYLVNEFFAVSGDIAVSEINYHPVAPTAGEAGSVPGVTDSDFEFIELRNIGARTVNLFDVKFLEGYPFEKTFALKPVSVAAGDFAFVVKNRAAFAARYGATLSAKIAGEWGAGTISDSGEEIRLVARTGAAIQAFTFADSGDWPGRADGKGSSLEYHAGSFGDADFNQPQNWRASAEFQGSPGLAGTGPDTRLAINEVLTHSNLPRVDAIELKNLTDAPLDISGWYLSEIGDPETPDSYKQFRIPSDTLIPANGYRVFTEVDFNPNGAWNPSPGVPGAGEFAFDAQHGDDAWVFEASATGKLLKFVDHVDFGPARADETWGRWPDGTGKLYPMAQRTLLDESSINAPRPGLGSSNALPRIGPLVISEVQHTPASGNTDLEFVEIWNPTATAQAFPQWRLRGDVDLDFGGGSLAAGAVMVLVPFAPSDTAKTNAFRLAYQLGPEALLIGPWDSGEFLTAAGEVVLYRAGTPPPAEPYYFPLTIEDETNYSSGGAWPATTSGNSMNRRGSTSVGDVPMSWIAGIPSPGTLGPTYAQWSAFWFPSAGAGSGPDDDADGDGASNVLEFTRGTLPGVYEDQALFAPSLESESAGGQTTYIFTYTKPIATLATYLVQKSPDLVAWENVPDTQVSSTSEAETREAVVVVPAGTPKLFFRLKTNAQ